MDLEQPSKADILADAKRQFRWKHSIPLVLWTILVITAISRLESPELVGQTRLIHRFVEVRITSILPHSLRGEVVTGES